MRISNQFQQKKILNFFWFWTVKWPKNDQKWAKWPKMTQKWIFSFSFVLGCILYSSRLILHRPTPSFYSFFLCGCWHNRPPPLVTNAHNSSRNVKAKRKHCGHKISWQKEISCLLKSAAERPYLRYTTHVLVTNLIHTACDREPTSSDAYGKFLAKCLWQIWDMWGQC